MTQEHPIAPPPELVQQWWDDFNGAFYEFEAITATVFQAGADQELEACCEWLEEIGPSGVQLWGDDLRKDRRPKPPSLKEQALALVEQHEDGWRPSPKDWDTIRLALEALPDD